MTRKHQQSFIFDSRLELVLDIGKAIKSLCLEQGMDEMGAYQVQTAVSEAINNAILHAYENQPGHQISVEFCAQPDELRVDVIDRGRCLHQLPPDIEPPVEAESGRGWWIMRRWMDKVDYSTDGGVNRLSLLRRL